MNVIELPKTGILDVVTGLRNLADEIEAGKDGEVFNIAYVIDSEARRGSFGLLGKASSPEALFLLLMELGKQRLLEELAK